MLNRIGIEASVETLPRSVFFDRASSGGPDGEPEFSLILVGWGAGSGEASSPLRSLIRTDGASNRGRYSNPEVDAVIDEALTTVDDPKRQDLLAKATEMAIEDVAIIPIHYQVNSWALKKGIGYEPRTDEWTLTQYATRRTSAGTSADDGEALPQASPPARGRWRGRVGMGLNPAPRGASDAGWASHVSRALIHRSRQPHPPRHVPRREAGAPQRLATLVNPSLNPFPFMGRDLCSIVGERRKPG